MPDYDEGNDGRFPGDSPVEVRYPRSKQEEHGDRLTWPWLPGLLVWLRSMVKCARSRDRGAGRHAALARRCAPIGMIWH